MEMEEVEPSCARAADEEDVDRGPSWAEGVPESLDAFRLHCRRELATVFADPAHVAAPSAAVGSEMVGAETLGEVVFVEPIPYEDEAPSGGDDEPLRIPEVLGEAPVSMPVAELEPLVYTAVLAAVRAVLQAERERGRIDHRAAPVAEARPNLLPRPGGRVTRFRRPDRPRTLRSR